LWFLAVENSTLANKRELKRVKVFESLEGQVERDFTLEASVNEALESS
jgi:hypothetical protein